MDRIRQAKSDHPPKVRLVHRGEMILGWFNCETRADSADDDRRIAEPLPGPTSDLVAKLVPELNPYVSLGLTERDGEWEQILCQEIPVVHSGGLGRAFRRALVFDQTLVLGTGFAMRQMSAALRKRLRRSARGSWLAHLRSGHRAMHRRVRRARLMSSAATASLG